MIVQLNYLKSRKAVDVGPVLAALGEQVLRSAVDPTHLWVSLDWIQYKKSFRRPIEPRRFFDADERAAPERELAIDVRRLNNLSLARSEERRVGKEFRCRHSIASCNNSSVER